MALAESEWIIMWQKALLAECHQTTATIAATAASKALWRRLRFLAPWAMLVPVLLVVMT